MTNAPIANYNKLSPVGECIRLYVLKYLHNHGSATINQIEEVASECVKRFRVRYTFNMKILEDIVEVDNGVVKLSDLGRMLLKAIDEIEQYVNK